MLHRNACLAYTGRFPPPAKAGGFRSINMNRFSSRSPFPIYAFLLAGLATLTGACSTESLSVQTQFPFSIATPALPLKSVAGQDILIPLRVSVDRITTQSAYSVRWRRLGSLTPVLLVDGKVLPAETLLKFTPPQALLTMRADSVGTYSFSLLVSDQSGESKELPLNIDVIR